MGTALALSPDLDAVWRATFGTGLRMLAITAAAEHEGTSTLALTLARRGAAARRRTLLVELTTRGSALADGHGLDRQDWSEAEGSADAAMRAFGEGLTVLPAPSLGRPSPALREVETLRALRARWLDRFDLVVLDLPPLLAADPHDMDPVTAASVADGTVLSVMARVTRETALIGAADLLRRAGVSVLGAVVNDRDNPTLADEMAREAGRLAPLAPGMVRRLQDWLRRRKTLRGRL